MFSLNLAETISTQLSLVNPENSNKMKVRDVLKFRKEIPGILSTSVFLELVALR